MSIYKDSYDMHQADKNECRCSFTLFSKRKLSRFHNLKDQALKISS